MDQIIHQLSELFIAALPTVLILVFLNFYLKATLFKPLGKVLAERDKLTKGARQTAEQSMQAADQKVAELEATLRDVRGEVYKEQETQRKKWTDEQAAQIASARTEAERLVQIAREEISRDAAAARESLKAEAAALAAQIEKNLLEQRV